MRNKLFLMLGVILLFFSCKKEAYVAPSNKKIRITLTNKVEIICDRVFEDKFLKKYIIDLNDETDVVISFLDIKKIDTLDYKYSVQDSLLYYNGYKQGQIDYDNNIIKYKKITQDNGEVLYEKVN